MTTNEVVIHSNDRIQNLLCGKQQRVGTAISKNSNYYLNSMKDYTDFSKYPFPDPIEPSRNMQVSLMENIHANVTKQASQAKPLIEFNKLRQDENMLTNVSSYLNVYDTNSRRKALMLHQELEEHYLQPLSKKLVKKTTGADYDKYVKEKTRAVTAFDKQTRKKDTFLKELPKIPTIKFDPTDLTDPILKYKKNAADEKRLTKIIQKSTGEWKEPECFPERDTMNLKKWKILAETRFYHGAGINTKKGKKITVNKYTSDVSTELDQFAPPIERRQYAQKPKADYQLDHINFANF